MNYSNINTEEYQKEFKKQCSEMCNLLSIMEAEFNSKKISLIDIGPRVSWYMFNELNSVCDHILSSENDDKIKEKNIMTQEIEGLKNTLLSLSQCMTQMSQRLDVLTSLVTEIVPPPAQTDGIDDDALSSEYCVSPSITANS
jgi:hypothetical protein